MELVNNIPEDIKRDWYFQKILDQLSRYGRVSYFAYMSMSR